LLIDISKLPCRLTDRHRKPVPILFRVVAFIPEGLALLGEYRQGLLIDISRLQ
jgi:hypothetical protein